MRELKIRKVGLKALEKLGVRVDYSKGTIVITPHKEEAKNDVYVLKKKVGQYTVTNICKDFYNLKDTKMQIGTLLEGDTINLIGEDFIYINGDLYRQAKVITAWTPIYANKIGWINMRLTDGPQNPPITKLLSGDFRVISKQLPVRDCDTLEIIGNVMEGDSIDFDKFNESITLKGSVLRKVIVKDCDNTDLINKKVYMPIFETKNSNEDNPDNEYRVRKDTKIYDTLEDVKGYNVFKGDTFKPTDESLQFIDGLVYQQVEIISAKNVYLEGRIGWIELRYTNDFKTTIKLVEDKYKKANNKSLADTGIPYKDIVLMRDILCDIPDNNSDNLVDSTIIRKGTSIRVFQKKDRYNRRYIELQEKGMDNIYRTKQYVLI